GAGNLTASGTVSFTDVYLTDTPSASATLVSPTTALFPYTTLFRSGAVTDTVNGLGGSVAWSFHVSDNAVDFLAAGQTLIETYTVERDSTRTNSTPLTVTDTITGTNKTPVITAHSNGAVTEDVAVNG